MGQDQIIRAGVTASVIAHLSGLALLVLVSEVNPLEHPAESIAVNIVSSTEAEPEQRKPPEPPQLPADSPAPTSPAPEVSAPAPAPAQANSQPQQPAPQQKRDTSPAAPKAQPGPEPPAYRQPEPDLTVKYNVMLGLPPELPQPGKTPAKSEEGFDETTIPADIPPSALAAFRRHLKTCSKLPASVQPSDHIVIKLRVYLRQDGRLAAEPVIGGGTANVKAIELLKGAIAGLKQCQPYVMLPAEHYGEWRVLDLDFTPRDFSG